MEFRPPENALALGSKLLGLDAHGDACFVSHAHADHTSFLRNGFEVIASNATLDLINARGMKRVRAMQQLDLDGAQVELHDAGHVLGARQISVECDGRKFVYTGDFNPVQTLTCKAAQPIDCEELLLDCTYSSPGWVFPERTEVYGAIAKWACEQLDKGFATLFGAYPLGKAQEIIAVLNKYAGTEPIVSSNVAKICAIYKKHGLALDYVPAGSDEASEFYKTAFVAVVSIKSLSLELADNIAQQYKRPVRTAIATGWALRNTFFGIDAAFPLSDHADFVQSLEFVEATNANRVWCKGCFTQDFARELRARGLQASAASKTQEKQKNLIEY